MLMMAYFEVNPEKDIKEIAKLGAQLVQAGKWPVKGTKEIAWYFTPSDPVWGIVIYEAESEEAVFNGHLLWKKAFPGIFSCFKVSPALPSAKAIPLAI